MVRQGLPLQLAKADHPEEGGPAAGLSLAVGAQVTTGQALSALRLLPPPCKSTSRREPLGEGRNYIMPQYDFERQEWLCVDLQSLKYCVEIKVPSKIEMGYIIITKCSMFKCDHHI